MYDTRRKTCPSATQLNTNLIWTNLGSNPNTCCQRTTRTHSTNQNLKITDLIDTIILYVSRDLPFSSNQPLKSVDDQYIRILKN